MYLSDVTLNVSNPMVIRDFNDVHRMHLKMASLLPGRRTGNNGYHLYRFDQSERRIIMQTKVRPQWSKFVRQNPNYLQGEPSCCEFHYPEYRSGDKVGFSVVANTEEKRIEAGGKAVALREQKEQIEWLQKQARLHGRNAFEIEQCDIVRFIRASYSPLDAYLHGFKEIKGKASQPLIFCKVFFQGVLKVCDPNDFKYVLEHGIGQKKAYGCGLMLLSTS